MTPAEDTTIARLPPLPLIVGVTAATIVSIGLVWIGLPVCLWLALRFTRMPVGPGLNAQLGRTALVQVFVGALLVVERLS